MGGVVGRGVPPGVGARRHHAPGAVVAFDPGCVGTRPGGADVALVDVEAYVVTIRADRRHCGAACTHERVEHEVAPIGVQLDESLRQLDGERRGVTHPSSALRVDLPDVGRPVHVVVAVDGVLEGQAFGLALGAGAGAVESALRGHDHALGEIAQHRVGRVLERSPGAVPRCALALAPDDLAAQEQPEVVLQDADHVGRQRAVRLAAEVGNVDGDATAWLELVDTYGEHLAKHLEVLAVRRRDVIVLEIFFVRLAREVGRRRDDQRDRAVLDALAAVVHPPRVEVPDLVADAERVHGVVGRQLRCAEALVEGGGVVALAATDPEVGRRRGTTPGLAHGAHRRASKGAGSASTSTAGPTVGHRRRASSRVQLASLAT